jgi:hypothetical protein
MKNPMYSTNYVNDLTQDPEVLGLNLSAATPRVLDLISKWALKQELEAVESENYEDAAKYRDILKCDKIFVRKTETGFEII